MYKIGADLKKEELEVCLLSSLRANYFFMGCVITLKSVNENTTFHGFKIHLFVIRQVQFCSI